MIKILNRKNILTVFLVFALLPVSIGLFCRCCEASPSSQTVVFEAPSCQGCCASLKAGDRCEATIIEKTASASFLSWSHLGFDIFKSAVLYGQKEILGTDTSPPGFLSKPALSSDVPIYLATQVLLI